MSSNLEIESAPHHLRNPDQERVGSFRRTRAVLGVILLLSLGLNAYLLWNYNYDVPDENFYPHSLQDAYFVRKHVKDNIFIIEHSGHRYTAECEDTLVWPNGIYTSARSLDGCTYISSLVGKSIADGLMRKQGSTLVYLPWEQFDTEQTADILKIIDDQKN